MSKFIEQFYLEAHICKGGDLVVCGEVETSEGWESEILVSPYRLEYTKDNLWSQCKTVEKAGTLEDMDKVMLEQKNIIHTQWWGEARKKAKKWLEDKKQEQRSQYE